MGKIQMGVPGRYDSEVEHLLRSTTARAAIVIVVDGYKGDGMSVAGRPSAMEWQEAATIVACLREHADYIEQRGGYLGVAATYTVVKPAGSA